jgi:hypothetical protein
VETLPKRFQCVKEWAVSVRHKFRSIPVNQKMEKFYGHLKNTVIWKVNDVQRNNFVFIIQQIVGLHNFSEIKGVHVSCYVALACSFKYELRYSQGSCHTSLACIVEVMDFGIIMNSENCT